VLDAFQKGDDVRIRADHIGNILQRQSHLRRDVVRHRERERVGRVLLAQPRLQPFVEPPRGFHRRHEYLVAPRIEQNPLQLLHSGQDELEQRGSGVPADLSFQRRDRRLAVLDQLVDNGGIRLDWWRGRGGRRA
jgi:hypothetical protein